MHQLEMAYLSLRKKKKKKKKKKKNTHSKKEGIGVLVVKVLDWRLEVSEFELRSRYNVHFRTNTFGKGMNTLSHTPSCGLYSITADLLER